MNVIMDTIPSAVSTVLKTYPELMSLFRKAFGSSVMLWANAEPIPDFEEARQIILQSLYQKVSIQEFLYAHTILSRSTTKEQGFVGAASLLFEKDFRDKLTVSATTYSSFLPFVQYRKGSINIYAAPPGRGKSYFLLTEAVYQAAQGRRVRVFVLGDMDWVSVFSRLMSIMKALHEKYVAISKDSMDNLILHIYPAGYLSTRDIRTSLNEEDDFVIIDYDDNVRVEQTGNMYKDAAILYEELTEMKERGYVFLVASQGRLEAWKSGGTTGVLAASSRKEHIADSIVVFRPAKAGGMVEVVKDRHFLMGGMGKKGSYDIKNNLFTFVPVVDKE